MLWKKATDGVVSLFLSILVNVLESARERIFYFAAVHFVRLTSVLFI